MRRQFDRFDRLLWSLDRLTVSLAVSLKPPMLLEFYFSCTWSIIACLRLES
jgi:hypothetical protein